MKLRTERLDLEPVELSDAQAALSGRRDPDWADDYPTEGDLVISRLIVDAVIVNVGRYVPFKIISRTPRLVVGGCGYLGPPDEAGAVEVGYGLAPSARGKGLATEAVRELVETAWQDPAVKQVFAATDRDNTPSHGVLLRTGFQQVGNDGQQIRWEIHRPPS